MKRILNKKHEHNQFEWKASFNFSHVEHPLPNECLKHHFLFKTALILRFPSKIGKLFAALRILSPQPFWGPIHPCEKQVHSPFHWRVQSFLGRWILGNLILVLRTLFNLDLFFRWFFPFYHGKSSPFFKKPCSIIFFLKELFSKHRRVANPSKGESNCSRENSATSTSTGSPEASSWLGEPRFGCW